MTCEHCGAARQPEGNERVEWGVRTVTEKGSWISKEGPSRVVAELRRDELVDHLTVDGGPNGFANGQRFVSAHLVRRTVTSFPDVVGEWTEVER